MASRVVYFGEDTCYRIAVLEAAGYAVEHCRSLEELLAAAGEDGCPVLVTEEAASAEFLAVARSCALGPLVLFRNSHRSMSESAFHVVVPVVHRPESWLADLGRAIERSASARLRRDGMSRPELRRSPGEFSGGFAAERRRMREWSASGGAVPSCGARS